MQESLEDVVLAEFRRALLLAPEEDVPLDVSFFDMGLTSLSLTELKQRLEAALDCTISARTLFNQPTVARLLEQLAKGIHGDAASPLPGAASQAADRAANEAADQDDAERTQWNGLLSDLYQQ